MSLSGSVESFPLKAVLTLLETSSAHGVLRLDAEAGERELHLAQGSLVDWQPFGNADAADVIAELLEADDLTFEWSKEAPVASHPPVSLHEIVRRAERRLQEWSEMRAIVPSTGHRLTLAAVSSAASEPSSFTLNALEWDVVRAIGDGRSMGEVLTRLEVPALVAYRTVQSLCSLGAVAVSAGIEPDAASESPVAEAIGDSAADASLAPRSVFGGYGFGPETVDEAPSSQPFAFPGVIAPGEGEESFGGGWTSATETPRDLIDQFESTGPEAGEADASRAALRFPADQWSESSVANSVHDDPSPTPPMGIQPVPVEAPSGYFLPPQPPISGAYPQPGAHTDSGGADEPFGYSVASNATGIDANSGSDHDLGAEPAPSLAGESPSYPYSTGPGIIDHSEQDDALVDRGPWPSDDLRSLVEQVRRESSDDREFAPSGRDDDALAAQSDDPTPPPAPSRSLERGALLRFLSSIKA